MNKKLLSGIFWFLLFILIIGFSAFYSNIDDFSAFFESLIGKDGRDGNLTKDRIERIFENQIIEEESTVIDVIDQVSPAVVSIVVETVGFDAFSGPFSIEDGIGTGFVVDQDGIVVTNSHVVETEDVEYSVVTKDGQTYDVETIHLDQISDLAILEIDTNGEQLPQVELGDSDVLKVGQIAIAIGNALGRFDNTVTVGVVSGIAREVTATGPFGENAKTYESVIQTDAALNPGNSGGPLLNSAGQVIGINVATTSGAENIGFAIPINTLKPLLESFFTEGRIIRPYIGVVYSMITPELARVRRIPEGAFVSDVIEDSPADSAGVEPGDIITKIDGLSLGTAATLGSFISQRKVGDNLQLELDRAGEILNLTVILEEAPEEF